MASILVLRSLFVLLVLYAAKAQNGTEPTPEDLFADDGNTTATPTDDNSDITAIMMNNTMNANATESPSIVVVVDPVDEVEESNTTNVVPIDSLFNTTTDPVNETMYTGCDIEDYYAGLPTDMTAWTMEDVEALLVKTHMQVLPSLGEMGEANILDALVDLDAGNTSDTVYLYMRDINFNADQQNTPEGWRRGDLWPLARGADLTTAAGTDVHSKRPEDWEVDAELRDLFWGTCGTVELDTECVTPAIPEQTAPTSATDDKIKTPPELYRGVVARQVLYTALRYRTELGLMISDCPPFNVSEYGYLSELLTWHNDFPVTDQEKERNARACSRWQGNRNPFVDYPQLVSQLYGEPDIIREGTLTYSVCTDPTDPPTATPNECSALSAGDINALIFNSDPIDQIVFFPVSDIDESIGSIFVTDRAWNGSDFVTDEGTIEYSIPPGGIKAGRVFGYGVQFPDDKGIWDVVDDSTFDLSSTQADSLLVYCYNADGVPQFLQALIYTNTGFSDAGLPFYEFNETSIPDDLTSAGVLALPFHANYLYVGPKEGNKEELLAAFADPANYAGSEVPYNINTSACRSKNLFAMTLSVALVIVTSVVTMV